MASRLIAVLLLLGTAQLAAQGALPATQSQAQAPAAATPPVVQAPRGGVVVAADYLIGAGDLLKITVYSEPALSGTFTVDNDGAFPYQYLDRVRAQGLTPAAVEAMMEKALGDGYLRNPQVSVEVAQYRSQNVYVQGQVRSPGKYPLPANASLMDAIFLAGGSTPEAGNWVEIWHGGTSAVPTGPAVAVAPGAKPDARVRLSDVQSGKAQSVSIPSSPTQSPAM